MSQSLDRSRKKLPRTEWNGVGSGSWDTSHANGTGGRSKRHPDRRHSKGSGSMGSHREHSWNNRNRPKSVNSEPPTLPRRTIRGVPPPGARSAKKKKKRSGKPWLCGLTVAIFVAIGALGCISAAFSTDYWVITDINRDAMNNVSRLAAKFTTYIYRSNNRGLFKTCYRNYDAKNTSTCLGELKYEINRRIVTSSWGDEYELYINLLRLTFVSLILGMVFQLMSIMGGIIICIRDSRKLTAVAIVISFFTLLFEGGGMGTFHAVMYYETYKVQHDIFPANWPDTHPELAKNYTQMYGWSYILCWVGIGLTVFTLLLYIVTYINLSKYKLRYPRVNRAFSNTYTGKTMSTHLSSQASSQQSEANSYYATSSKASRNFAYDMAEFDVPPPDELDCIEEDLFSESTQL